MKRTMRYAAGYLAARALYDAGVTKRHPNPIQGKGIRVWWHNASPAEIFVVGWIVAVLVGVLFVIGAFGFLVILDQFTPH